MALAWARPALESARACSTSATSTSGRSGRAVLLLHGWPYDIHSFVECVCAAEAGYRVIVPYLRGTARRASFPMIRPGTGSRRARRRRDRADGCARVDEAIVGGFDWGARTANIMAALWPERCRRWCR